MKLVNNFRIALLYDKIVTWGGAERLLLLIHNVFPEAPIYTAIYDKISAKWAGVFIKIGMSRLSNWIFRKNYHWATPLLNFGFEGFELSKYNLVISITSYSAKSVITRPETRHICYCFTPDRYLWFERIPAYDTKTLIGKIANAVEKALRPLRQIEDQFMATRPDYFLTISKKVAKRIKKYYGRDSQVVYPGVDTNFFGPGRRRSNDYFLIVGRLTGYKQIELVIKAFHDIQEDLVVVGEGAMKKNLISNATSNVKFMGQVSEIELLSLYQNAKALIAVQEEDFGLVVLEALACGTPVIVNSSSGVSEILNEKCALMIDRPDVKQVKKTINQFEKMKFSHEDCRKLAVKYDDQLFLEKFEFAVRDNYRNYLVELNSRKAFFDVDSAIASDVI